MITSSFAEATRLIPEPMLVVRADGTVLDFNAAATRFTGLRPGAILFDLVTDPAPAVHRALRRWATSGDPVAGSLTFRGVDQQVVRCRCRGARMRWAGESRPVIGLRANPLDSTDGFAALTNQIRSLNSELGFRRGLQAERDRLLVSEQQARQHLQAMVDGLAAVVWEADADSRRCTFVSGPAERLLGRTAAELIGTVFVESGVIHPDDLADVCRQAERSTAVGHYTVTYRVRHLDGRARWVRDAVHVINGPDGTPRLLQGVIVDVTDAKTQELRDRFFAELERALQPVTDPDEVLTLVARRLAEHLEADQCGYAEVDDAEDDAEHGDGDGEQVCYRVLADFARPGMPPLAQGRISMTGLGADASRTLRAGQPWILTDTETDDRLEPANRANYRRARVRATVRIPVMKAGRYVAGLAVHQATPRDWTSTEIETVAAVANRCWESLQRLRALHALRDSEQRHRMLVHHASDGIWLTDRAQRFVDVNPAGATMLGYPRQQLLGRRFHELLAEADQPLLNRRLAELATGATATEVWHIRAAAGDYVPVELSARTTADGQTLILGRDVTERLRHEAEQEAQRRREHEVVEVLQRALLPRQLPALARLAAAARYLPASAQARAGGDWYDMLPIDATTVALVIGDVVGNGPVAATVMGQLRSALASYLLEGHSPAAALERLDRFAHLIDGATGSSCGCLTLNWHTGELRWALAGHPPVLLIEPDNTRLLTGGNGTILGVTGRPAYPEASATVTPGSTLLLYTDGLIERRDEPIDAGLQRLLTAASLPEANPDSILERVLRQLIHGAEDDIAVIAVRLVPDPLHQRLPATPAQLGPMRRAVRRWARSTGLPEELLQDLQLALGEAAANAVEHAYSGTRDDQRHEFDYTLTRTPTGGIDAHVRDYGQWRPAPADPGYRGRGLRAIQTLAETSIISPGPDGTEITFTLLAPPCPVTNDVPLAPESPPHRVDSPVHITVDTTAPRKPSTVRLHGELDPQAVTTIRDQLLDTVRSNPGGHTVIDTTELRYLCSAGVALLVEATNAAEAVTATLTVVIAEGSPPARILTLTGLRDTLTVHQPAHESPHYARPADLAP
ncbi:MAG TPA: SpoIIE family protein phosphatase [Pseudonocardia sp.]|nr:SpoIIE family protein phosphatase [Pseudonocardia sp.]